MNEKAKSNSIITHAVDMGAQTITIKVLGAGDVTLRWNRVSVDNAERARYHGMIQRLSDRGALSRNSETGAAATPEDKLRRIREYVEFLETGTKDWSITKTGGGGRKPKGPDMAVVRAVAEVRGRAVAEVLAILEKNAEATGRKLEEMLAKIELDPKFSATVARIRAEAVTDDAEDMLEGL